MKISCCVAWDESAFEVLSQEITAWLGHNEYGYAESINYAWVNSGVVVIFKDYEFGKYTNDTPPAAEANRDAMI